MSKNKVLLVDDDPMIVKMYQRKLVHDGFDVKLAFNGEECLKILTKDLPDIILLDIMMPKMNGIDTLKVIKSDKKTKKIPVFILTNLGDRPEDVAKAKELGAKDYIVKANIQLDELMDRIKKVVK